MKPAQLERSIGENAASRLSTAATVMNESESTTMSTRKTSLIVGACFLAATFTFAVANVLIDSYFSSATPHQAVLVAGVFLLGCCGLAVATNAAAMRKVLAPSTPNGAGLLRHSSDRVPHPRGGGRVLLDEPRAVECLRALRLLGVRCRRTGPVASPADVESRAEGPGSIGSHRLSGLLGGDRLVHVPRDRRDARSGDACARPRRPLRVALADLALHQGICAAPGRWLISTVMVAVKLILH